MADEEAERVRVAEELRLRREEEDRQKEAEDMEKRRIQKEQEEKRLAEMKERMEKRRKEEEEMARRIQEEEEQRVKREEELAIKRREDIEKRRKQAEEKRKQLEAMAAAAAAGGGKAGMLAANIARAREESKMTKDQLDAMKNQHLDEKYPPVEFGRKPTIEKLVTMAKNFHNKLTKFYGDVFDLGQRQKRQDYDKNELQARIKDMLKHEVSTKEQITVETNLVKQFREEGFRTQHTNTDDKMSILLKRRLRETAYFTDAGGVKSRYQNFSHVPEGVDLSRLFTIDRSQSYEDPYEKIFVTLPWECEICHKEVYQFERLAVKRRVFHRHCFRCVYCMKVTNPRDYGFVEGKIYCRLHLRKLARERLEKEALEKAEAQMLMQEAEEAAYEAPKHAPEPVEVAEEEEEEEE
ncbi:calponin homology domain-containing protein DDB_G0272472-like isoform X3 [Anneissia japonica]|uniref:calponin homology domain-containing protein DDB_G0272472-like isoform X3 n=1 Tax=Anneissia japonica TaxID=1529436 RepID=UPI0014258468|nr:calponin homology domain-containing protein DDB_G0272472-like isoform X3 [Anneissia japonica]